MILPSASLLPTQPSHLPAASEPRLSGRVLLLARIIWALIAVWLLASWVTSLSPYVGFLRTVCTAAPTQCPEWQLTPGNVQALHHLGLPVDAYVAYFITVQILVSLVFFTVTALIFWRKSNEWMGLAVSLLLINFGASGISSTLNAFWNTTSLLLYVPGLVFGPLLGLLQWPALAVFLLTFPNGRFAPRWTWMMVLLWIAQEGFFWVDALGLWVWPGWLLAPVVLLTWGSTAAVQIYRFRRVYTQMQRQQTKWLVFGVATALVIGFLSNAVGGLVPGLNAPDSSYQLLSGFFTGLLFVSIPLSVGIAILRYRLWDIDTIINKALVYGSLTALLGALYVGLILGLESLAGLVTQQANQPVALVISTLAIAALFMPVRRGIQALIDRRFYRRKYDAEKTLAAFSAMLQSEVDLEQIRKQVLAVVQETMQPAHVSLWLLPPERPFTEQAHRLERHDEGSGRPSQG